MHYTKSTSTLIGEIEKLVEETCARETNIFGYGIWTHHITKVAENGRQLAQLFGADPEIVEVAALLHDYASVKDKSLYEGHHIHGPLEAEKILKEFRYPPQKIEAVKHCIEAHRASVLQVGNCRGHRMDKKQIRTELEQA